MRSPILTLTVGAFLAGVLVGCQPNGTPATNGDPTPGGGPAGTRAPRAVDGKPNLNGVWQVMNTANWDIQDHDAQPGPYPHLLGAWFYVPPGNGVVEGNELPYQPWALEKRKENFTKRMVMDTEDLKVGDPEAKCYMPGVPRATYMPYPFQIIQNAGSVFFAYEYAGAMRDIYFKDPGPAETDSWMGQPVGRWEGDTLVIVSTGFNGDTWFDRSGTHHSNQLKVTERFTLTGPNHIRYEAVMEDPEVFTAPWKISLPLYRRMEPDARIMDFKCVEFVEELIYGEHRRKPLSR